MCVSCSCVRVVWVASMQVVQYLLANNYYLTALELLVESQQAGHGDQVLELEVGASSRVSLVDNHTDLDTCS